jgi:NAD(P)-dependent dehydrogenase (short-subunit alcohol dehydrogenase family)
MGPIEVWVNNAMTSIFAPFMDTDPEDFERATAVTYFGFVNGTRAALRRMKPRDRGVLSPGRLGAGLPRDSAAGGRTAAASTRWSASPRA